MRTALTIVATAVLLTACSSAKFTPAETNPTDMPKGPGLFSGESGNLLHAFNERKSGDQGGGQLGVSVYMWRAALSSISFMPILTADSQGGVITTDWYAAPQNPAERVKANIIISSKTLRADGLQVTLFKQTKDSSGKWADTPADPATARALEDAILTKARALRVQSLAK